MAKVSPSTAKSVSMSDALMVILPAAGPSMVPEVRIKLAPVILPVAEISPPVSKFPPVILAALVIVEVAEIRPAVSKLPPVTLAAEVMVEVAEINPPVNKLPPVMLAVAVT